MAAQAVVLGVGSWRECCDMPLRDLLVAIIAVGVARGGEWNSVRRRWDKPPTVGF